MLTKIIIGILSLFFLFASSIKILGWQKAIFEVQLKYFKSYGLNRTIMAAVGVIELYGAIALWLPGYIGMSGAGAILITSVGAITCHLWFDTWKEGIPAMVTLTLSTFILYSNFSAMS